MDKLDILTYPDKTLSQPTTPLDNIDGKVQEMIRERDSTRASLPGCARRRRRRTAA